jgi:hypothetical protein
LSTTVQSCTLGSPSAGTTPERRACSAANVGGCTMSTLTQPDFGSGSPGSAQATGCSVHQSQPPLSPAAVAWSVSAVGGLPQGAAEMVLKAQVATGRSPATSFLSSCRTHRWSRPRAVQQLWLCRRHRLRVHGPLYRRLRQCRSCRCLLPALEAGRRPA